MNKTQIRICGPDFWIIPKILWRKNKNGGTKNFYAFEWLLQINWLFWTINLFKNYEPVKMSLEIDPMKE